MAELITAIAQLLWPLILVAVLVLFRGSVRRVLATAERRELEVEVGGQKLTMHELNDQQNEMIQDLQRQVSALSAQLHARDQVPLPVPGIPQGPQFGSPPQPGTWPAQSGAKPQSPAPPQQGQPSQPLPPDQHPSSSDSSAHGDAPANGNGSPNGNGSAHDAEAPAPRETTGTEPFAVLWVAERPEAHALLVEQLRDNGVRVTTATTTAEAVELACRRPHRLVVSDMGRREDGRWRPDAGLALLGELRDLGVDAPVVVFSDHRGEVQYAAQARRAGAVAVTSSAAEMVGHFRNFDLL